MSGSQIINLRCTTFIIKQTNEKTIFVDITAHKENSFSNKRGQWRLLQWKWRSSSKVWDYKLAAKRPWICGLYLCWALWCVIVYRQTVISAKSIHNLDTEVIAGKWYEHFLLNFNFNLYASTTSILKRNLSLRTVSLFFFFSFSFCFHLLQIPVSVCSEKCPPGTRKVLMKGKPVCFHDCVLCAEGEMTNNLGFISFYSCFF